MSPNRRSEFASPFDAMLAETRAQFNALYGGGAPAAAPVPVEAASAASGSEAELNARYGTGWRHEITERRREGDEAVVLCRLTIPQMGIVKAQFARAPIGGGSNVAGHAGGVAFRAGGAGDGDEAAAFAAAAEAALAKCLALL